MNALTEMPSLDQCPQLAHVHLSGNQITDLGFLCNDNLKLLAEVDVSKNKIADLPHEISLLVALKKFDVSENALKSVPGELSDCLRMKDLILGSNPLSDNRLKKMVDQKGTKAVMDYIRQHGERAGGAAGGGGGNCSFGRIDELAFHPMYELSFVGGGGGKKGKGKKGKKGNSGDVDTTTDMDAIIDRIDVLHMRDGSPEIVVHESVKAARPYIVCFIVRDLDLSEAAKFKSFIQLQTKLHETVCAKRNAATIATHDLSKVPAGNLDYIAVEPGLLEIVPLNKKTPFKAVDLVKHLRDEAEAVRKVGGRTLFPRIQIL